MGERLVGDEEKLSVDCDGLDGLKNISGVLKRAATQRRKIFSRYPGQRRMRNEGCDFVGLGGEKEGWL